jgi:RNA polymerase I-specific transcription initiation factor RRN3
VGYVGGALAESPAAEEGLALLHEITKQSALLVPRDHDLLVKRLFAVDLHQCDPRACEAILTFCCSLVTANPQFGSDVLRKLVHSLSPPSSSEAATAVLHRNEDTAVLARVRSTIERVLWLVPSLTRTAVTTLVGCTPHKRVDKCTHLLYMRSVYRLLDCENADPLRDSVLLGFIDRLLEVDVEIRWEDFADVREEEHDGIDEGVFDFEKESQRQQQRSASTSADVSSGFAEGTKIPVDEAAEKMDCLMQETIEHISRRERGGGKERMFQTLMQAFNATMLHTYKSKFTQFLIFHLCSLDSSGKLGRSFARHISSRIFSSSDAVNTRMAAAGYLSSFLARASFVSHADVLENLWELVQFCQRFVRSETHQMSPWSNERPVFEACFQAILYVLCYRADAILRAGGNNATSLKKLPLTELLRHKLSPLRACLPAVVTEFAKRADALTDCASSDEVMRLAGPHASNIGPDRRSDSAADLHVVRSESKRTLDTFFPFDPYLLRESSKHMKLNESYIKWSPPDAEEDDEEDDDEEDEESDDDDEQEGSDNENVDDKIQDKEQASRERGKHRKHHKGDIDMEEDELENEREGDKAGNIKVRSEGTGWTSPSSSSPYGMSVDEGAPALGLKPSQSHQQHAQLVPSPV